MVNSQSIYDFVSVKYPNHLDLYRRLCATNDKHIAGALKSLNEGVKKYVALSSEEVFETMLQFSSPDEYLILVTNRIQQDLQGFVNSALCKIFPSLLPRMIGYILGIDGLHKKSKEEQDEICCVMFLAAAKRHLKGVQ